MFSIIAFFKSTLGKYILFGSIYLGTIAYFSLKVMLLDNAIADLKTNNAKLAIDNTNLTTINKENINVINKYILDVKKLKEANTIITIGKDDEILKLKRIIKNFKKPVVYPKEIIQKECKIKIKTRDLDENSTFNSISNIGF